jgi:homoserine O-succinyltransferase
MPDAALGATELQFQRLLTTALPDRPIDLQLYAFDTVERDPAIRARMAKRYGSTDLLPQAGLDALIVTGAEPKTADLRDEPFWSDFARMTEWTVRSRTPVLWSCMAAHAAVLHLDGIRRVTLARKCSGVFDCLKADPHALTADMPRAWPTPHSRLNTLDEGALRKAGYTILSLAPDAGVDAFAGRADSAASVFLQGHPEYDANSLAAEYSRDILRYAQGLRPRPPAVPVGYFSPEVSDRLEAILGQASTPGLLKSMTMEVLREARPSWPWRDPWTRFYEAWLEGVASLARLA